MGGYSPFDDEIPFGFGDSEQGKRLKPVLIGIVVVAAALVAFRLSSFAVAGSSDTFEVEETETVTKATQEAEAEETVCVHVVGCVNAPGVYVCQKGARLADAVSAAGGFTEDAAADAVNLAREVTDGEQVRIPSAEEAAAQSQAPYEEASSGGSSANASATSSASDGKVNVNTATSAQLQTVSGIGEVTAQKIIDERETNGPFSSVDDLTRVSGIGEKKLASLRDYLTV